MYLDLGFLIYKYIKKNLILITILILLIQISFISKSNIHVVLGLFFFSDQNKPIMLTYENYGLKFKIDYPNDWEKSSKLNNETIFIAPKESDSVSSPAGLVVKVISLKSNKVSVDSISNALISQLKNDHKDFKLEADSQFNIGAKNGKQIIFTATDNNLQLRKALQIITINNNKIFIITYKASIDKYSKYENTIKDMLSSFKFLP
jgi:hypothetical protein